MKRRDPGCHRCVHGLGMPASPDPLSSFRPHGDGNHHGCVPIGMYHTPNSSVCMILCVNPMNIHTVDASHMHMRLADIHVYV
jgi:hypothetical protein